IAAAEITAFAAGAGPPENTMPTRLTCSPLRLVVLLLLLVITSFARCAVTVGRANRSLLAAEGFDVDGRAHLGLEVLLEPIEHALLELSSALSADVIAVAELLKRERLVGQPALAEDRLLAALERVRERFELAAQELREFALRDRAIGTVVVARQIIEPRARAVVVRAERRIERGLGRGEPALHLDDLALGHVELLGQQ